MAWKFWNRIVEQPEPNFRLSAWITSCGKDAQKVHLQSKIVKNSRGIFIELSFSARSERPWEAYTLEMDVDLARRVIRLLYKRLKECETELEKCKIKEK